MARPSSLPSSRSFLTSLVDSIPGPAATTAAANVGNPLRSLTGRDRNIFLTLHVLFPNELLPALDLLDRGLVTRFHVVANSSFHPSSEAAAATATATSRSPPRGEPPLPPHDYAAPPQRVSPPPATPPTTPTRNYIPHPPLYFVQSAQQPAHHPHRAPPPPSYEVRLDAWNCSCPAFAFAAYPPAGPARSPSPPPPPPLAGPVHAAGGKHTQEHDDGDDGDSDRGDGDGERPHSPEWQFGGRTCTGQEPADAVPPVCKHLLACVLAEHGGCLRTMAGEREVAVEEAAGWAAGWGS